VLAALLDNYDLQIMEDPRTSTALITFKSKGHSHMIPDAGRRESGYDTNAKLAMTTETIKGLYSYSDVQSGRLWSGHTVTLGDRTFTYQIFTDAGNDPHLKDYPQHGTFTLDGCLLTLTFPDGKVSHNILTRQRGRFVMWSPKEYDEYLRTGVVSDSVLFQQPSP
jgi:hypothetical protein